MKDQHIGEYYLSCKRWRFTPRVVMPLLKLTYWAKNRDEITVKRCLKHSFPFGVFDSKGKLVGFLRVTSDQSTVYYIADVIVTNEERGKGLGLALVKYALSHPTVCRGKGLLLTQTANGLYEKVGFHNVTNKLMERDPVSNIPIA